MDSQTDGLLIQRAIRQFTPDVFQHPVWTRFAAARPGPIHESFQPLKSVANQLLAKQDVHGACAILFLYAAGQASQGDYSTALDSIEQVMKLARRHHLSQDALWGYWAASALCLQVGAYSESARYLLRMQQELYSSNEWVLADLIDLVRQSLIELNKDGEQAGFPSLSTDQDRFSLLIEQMLSWGIPPLKSAALAAGSVAVNSSQGMLSPTGLAKPGMRLKLRGWRSFWQHLLRFIPNVGKSWLRSWAGREEPGPAAPGDQIAVTSQAAGGQLAAQPRLSEPTAAGLPGAPGNNRKPDQHKPALPEPPSIGKEHARTAEKAMGVNQAETSQSIPAQPAQMLKVYLLGSFRVELEGSTINNWPSGRSRAVFAYLLAHHSHLVPRETLMETFWPETSIDLARNSLNVAVFNLRHALKSLLDAPVILLHDSAYQINPDLQLWLDVEEFEQHVRDALHQENAGAINQTVNEYRLAVGLYQEDFLADTPYEDWTMLERERLRVVYLEILDRLSIIHFNQGQYADCITLCQQILSHDTCREDAHCRLMRCFARQGQAHLALRQYQVCVEALRSELDVEPSPGTKQLFEKIHQRGIV